MLRVAKHEFLVTAANKAFVVITLLGPILILALSVLPGLLAANGSGSTGSVIALVGGDQGVAASLPLALAEAKAKVETVADEQAARDGISSGRYSAALILGADWQNADKATLLAKTGTDYALYARIEAAIGAMARQAKAAKSGVDPAVLASILKTPSLDVQRLDRSDSSSNSGGVDAYLGILFTALAFVMLMYMTVLLYGQLIGRSVLQEKSAKTVEIMLSSVSPRDLLAGKILGPGLAGLIQYAFWIIVALAGIKLIGPHFHIAMPATLTATNLAWLVAFFIPAYFLYASAYAALGAGAEDEQHLGQLAWPLLIFLMIPMVMISPLVTNPDSAIAIVFSYFPLTSPIVMLIRVLVSTPAWWELAISYALLLISVWAMARLAAKVFRVGILMTGKRRDLGEILKWIAVK
jgi:ABC-type Na+ efflux pump, permease component